MFGLQTEIARESDNMESPLLAANHKLNPSGPQSTHRYAFVPSTSLKTIHTFISGRKKVGSNNCLYFFSFQLK